MLRAGLVWLHRWVGLLMAGFLIVEGLTGSLLAFRLPLERWVMPGLFAAPQPGIPAMGLGELAERAGRLAPQAVVTYFSVEERQVVVHVLPRRDPATGKAAALPFDRIFLDPWTGRELGRRLEGDLSQGRINWIPFIYRLHMSLALGDAGVLVLGIVALAWTMDCFVGLYLTLPISLSLFLSRWGPAWLVKWRASAIRIHFDLHRAGGLWLWPLLFVFAWSSVYFNLNTVYENVTTALFDYRSDMDLSRSLPLRRNASPKLGWKDAQVVGERLMAAEALRHGFGIVRPYGMAYIEDWGVYTYAVTSDRRVQEHGWSTSLWLDGDSGALVDVELPRGEHTGNTIGTWLRALHFADLWDAVSYRVVVCVAGIVVTMLSVTGVYIWFRKQRARRHARQRGGARRAYGAAPVVR